MKWDDSLPADWDDAPTEPPMVAVDLKPELLGVGLRPLRVSTAEWV